MLLIFRLGRPDVLPVDDYGVRKGFAVAFRKRELPTAAELERRGARWKPFRSVASWYLWRAAERARTRDAGEQSKPAARAQRSMSPAVVVAAELRAQRAALLVVGRRRRELHRPAKPAPLARAARKQRRRHLESVAAEQQARAPVLDGVDEEQRGAGI